MLRLKSYKGFTLVEVVLVILIIGILAGIVIPRITYTSNEARRAACTANVSAMNATIEYGVAVGTTEVNYPALLADLTNADWDDYFPEGLPACPFGTAYVVNAISNRINQHVH